MRRRRAELGISQEELALRSNLNRTYVGEIEQAKRNISLLNMEKLAIGLGVNMAAVFSEYGADFEIPASSD